MRPAQVRVPALRLALATALLAAPALAEASVRLHVPHEKRHRGRKAEPAAPAPPTSDIPDPVWVSSHTRR